MRSPRSRNLEIIGGIAGFLLALLSLIPLGMWMNDYEKRAGFDAGNAGILGCFAVFVFPVAGWLIGALISDFVNRQA